MTFKVLFQTLIVIIYVCNVYMCAYMYNHTVYLRYTIRYFDDTEIEVLIGEWKRIVAADNLVRSTRSVTKTNTKSKNKWLI